MQTEKIQHIQRYMEVTLIVIENFGKRMKTGYKNSPGFTSLQSKVIFAVRNEMAQTVEDVCHDACAIWLDARAATECTMTVAQLIAQNCVMMKTGYNSR